MAKMIGTVKRSDLEGGLWLLVTDKGEQFQLVGAKNFVAGQRIEVHGKVEKDAMGFGMSGPIFRVDKFEPCE
jgi:hypothetical protein